jgi:hypothetical protein
MVVEIFREKTDKEVKSLSDKNLLAYYRAERKRYQTSYARMENDWNHTPTKEDIEKHETWKRYLHILKVHYLDKRPHVQRKRILNKNKNNMK